MPQIAIAGPWRSGGLMSSRIAWLIGMSAAPNMPWSSRKPTSSPRLVAMPHSPEAMVKPMIEICISRLRPIRPASQPVSGVMIAAATMYEVSTQVIWSAEAETLPCMCGSATLAMVASSEFITVAAITEPVMNRRVVGSG